MKKVISLLLSLILLLSLPVSVFAAEPGAPKVVDNADLLTAEEEAVLTNQAYDLVYAYGMDVVILTVPDMDGYSAQTYADDYYDRNGYSDDGLLLLVAMEEREWYISTCGQAIYAFTDYGLDCIGEEIVPYLSGGDYYGAFCRWLEVLPEYFEAYLNQAPIDNYKPGYYEPEYRDDVIYYGPQRSVNHVQRFFIALLIGIIAALVTVLIMRSRMNTARPQRDAGEYMRRGSYHITAQRDLFLYSRVSKTPRPKDNGGHGGGHGGGSSVHHSSGGRSHGGRGGGF